MKLTPLVLLLCAGVAFAAPQGHGRGHAKPKAKHKPPAKAASRKPGAKPKSAKAKAPAAAASGAKGAAAEPAPAPTPAPTPAVTPQPKRKGAEGRAAELADDKPATYFAACDYDKNDWISFREADEALGIDRAGFAVYDTDHDGRVTEEEFEKRFLEVRERTGGFPPPRQKSAERLVPTRNAEQLRNAYDLSGDGAIDLDELTKLLTDYERTQVPPDVVLEKLDRDNDDELSGQELVLFAQLLSATYTPEQAIIDPENAPKTIDALFGQVTPREQGYNTSPQPPQISGPVPTFRRLDLDNDGYITVEDLETLRAAAQYSVRTTAIFAALDTDQDGYLTEDEFYGSMRKLEE
jgi:Ca2+-binding EF-hand superfamily protein